MLFALLDIIGEYKAPLNFLVLDEVFDNLDEIGLDRVIKLLYNIPYKNVFVISHNKEMQSYFDSVITVKNQGGQSYIDAVHNQTQ